MKRLFSLSPRLQAVAELVPHGAKLVDVGTDHGQLPVWLICQGRIVQAVATDLRSGPLSKGQALAERWNVTDKVSFRLCDGLNDVDPAEAEIVTIAGMGGETIADILQAASWTREPGRQYILQAMSGMDGLRRYLSGNGFSILREILVKEGETLYVILLVEPGEMTPLSEGEIWVGRQNPNVVDPLRGRYLEQELQKLCWATEGVARSKRENNSDKQKRLEDAVRMVENMKQEWQKWQL